MARPRTGLVRWTGVGLGALNVLLLGCGPWLHELYRSLLDQPEPKIRTFNSGTAMQELLVYFDPATVLLLGILFTIGFCAVGFLKKPANAELSIPASLAHTFADYGILQALIYLEIAWLTLTFVCVCCRGPNWNFYYPWERWDDFRVVVSNSIDFSEYFWHLLLAIKRPELSVLRELPGIILVGIYFSKGFLLATMLYRATTKSTPWWRWMVLILLLQCCLLVPLKMALRLIFNIRYVIYFPDIGLNL